LTLLLWQTSAKELQEPFWLSNLILRVQTTTFWKHAWEFKLMEPINLCSCPLEGKITFWVLSTLMKACSKLLIQDFLITTDKELYLFTKCTIEIQSYSMMDLFLPSEITKIQLDAVRWIFVLASTVLLDKKLAIWAKKDCKIM